ncbi:MAG: VOC family protein [Anaerolineaceae bacterium]|nr:VOC family protein [Anaerolineaceae bacterium]
MMDVKKLPAGVRIGAVHLTAPGLERSIRFYRDKLGMRLIRETSGGEAWLGTGGEALVVLHENPTARRARGTTGLYHFAVLLPSRQDLALVLVHLSEQDVSLQGVGDHGVSEALYLADMDGNGIELYADRPRAAWPRDGHGDLRMVTDPVDIDGLIAELGETPPPWQGLPAATRIGHIHLQVANLPAAEAFYSGIVGLDLVQRLGASAAFFSVGGYHHHVAVNTWAGVGAPPPPPDSTGLCWFELHLPDAEALSQVRERIEQAGLPLQEQEGGWLVRDPSQNGVLLTTA